MASDVIQNGAFAEQKTVAATISIHTHTHAYTPHTFKHSSDFGHYKIQTQFQTFLDIVYNVENKIDFAKNRGIRAPWIRPCIPVTSN